MCPVLAKLRVQGIVHFLECALLSFLPLWLGSEVAAAATWLPQVRGRVSGGPVVAGLPPADRADARQVGWPAGRRVQPEGNGSAGQEQTLGIKGQKGREPGTPLGSLPATHGPPRSPPSSAASISPRLCSTWSRLWPTGWGTRQTARSTLTPRPSGEAACRALVARGDLGPGSGLVRASCAQRAACSGLAACVVCQQPTVVGSSRVPSAAVARCAAHAGPRAPHAWVAPVENKRHCLTFPWCGFSRNKPAALFSLFAGLLGTPTASSTPGRLARRRWRARQPMRLARSDTPLTLRCGRPPNQGNPSGRARGARGARVSWPTDAALPRRAASPSTAACAHAPCTAARRCK